MKSKPTTKKINLALQGGGSHGAYTWGVLERLLEEKELEIEAISGTSAGAMNAAVLVSGYANGGREGATKLLEKFWRRLSEVGAFSPMHKSPIERMITGWNMDSSPTYHWFDLLSRVFSPYELNPLNVNPLKHILDDVIDVDAFDNRSGIKIFVSATHVQSGHARMFSGSEITTDALLASACIPFLFQAVEIGGESYWDGGYMGNPAIWPLIYSSNCEDIVLVQINPIHNDHPPRSATEIVNRLNEITFNSSLIAEMRAIEFVSRLIREGKLEKGRYKDMRMHLIYDQEEMRHLNASSKVNADWDFFMHLREIGRVGAESWLQKNWASIGVESTLDIKSKFLAGTGIRSSGFATNDRMPMIQKTFKKPLAKKPRKKK